MDYNRVLKDKAGKTTEELMAAIGQYCNIEKKDSQYKPECKGVTSMYVDGDWYKLTYKDEYVSNDAVDGLDVAFLQKYILDGIWGIADPKTDSRIDFVGGIRGLGELQKRVDSGEMVAAFALFPVTMRQIINIADTGNIMPPKTTWFEPKLRRGLVIHKLS